MTCSTSLHSDLRPSGMEVDWTRLPELRLADKRLPGVTADVGCAIHGVDYPVTDIRPREEFPEADYAVKDAAALGNRH